MAQRRLTRRHFLSFGAVAGVGALLAACGGGADVPATATSAGQPTAAAGQPTTAAGQPTKAAGQPTVAAGQSTAPAGAPKSATAGVKYAEVVTTIPAKFTDSPVLAEQIKAGKLPPIKERLPEEPLVVKPIEIGRYGGTARVGISNTDILGGDQGYLGGTVQNFLRFNPDLTGVVPNVATKVDVSEDKMTYTIHLRKGLKWSDGEPVTAQDALFSFEDIIKNTDITPAVPLDFQPGGKVMEMSAPDDHTIVIKFAVPWPRFLLGNLAHYYGWQKNRQLHPAHYLKQFHSKYNAKADEEAKAAKYNSWIERFTDTMSAAVNPQLPALSAFVVDQVTPTVVTFRRNPYFWQVDTEGNQLPYIDVMEMERLQDVSSYDAKIVTGAYDYAVANTSVLNYATYDNSAAAGKYRVLLWSSGRGAEVFFQVNMNVKDEVLRKIHQDVRYRRALSLAIDRDQINQLLFFGRGTPRQLTVIPESKYFKPEYERGWSAFDLNQANQLLDEIGLKWNTDKTVRLRPDGKPMAITFDYYDAEGPKTPVLELVTEFWRKVGVDVSAKAITRTLLTPRVKTNEEAMSLWHGDASTDVLLPVDRKWSTGKFGDEGTIAPLWNQWFETGGKGGEEPADWYKEALTTWQKYSETLDPALAAKVLQSQADNVWSIGTVGMAPWPFIARNTLRNVPESGIHTWDGLFQYPYHAETFFFMK